MKKFICLLAALLLTLSCAFAEETAAETADQREADLLDIWQTDGESRTWITAAIPVMDGILMTSPALLPEKKDSLTVSDGQNEWKAEVVIPDSSGVMALVFFDPGQNLPQRGTWPMMPYGDSVKASACIVRSGDADGGRTDRRVRSAASMEWKGRRCLLLDLEGDTCPGAAVLNDRGELAGMVVAEYAEGIHRVLALPAEELVQGISEAGSILSNLSAWGDPPEGFSVTAEKNDVTIDWSAMTLPDHAEGESLYLVVADIGNDYLNYYPADMPDRRIRMILTPGRVYVSGIVASAESPDEHPEQYAVTVIPAAETLTEYGFRPTLTAIAEMPADAKAEQAPGPVTEVTEELLRSGRAYFYSASAYEVEEETPGKTLLVTLTDPEGNNYRYESAWIYAPEYMQEDIWYVPLSETGLTRFLDEGGYPRGEYQMAYYVDGDLADTITFELK